MLILFGCAHTVHTTLCFVSIQAHQFRFFISFAFAHARVLTKKCCKSILHNLWTLLLLAGAAYACRFSLTCFQLHCAEKQSCTPVCRQRLEQCAFGMLPIIVHSQAACCNARVQDQSDKIEGTKNKLKQCFDQSDCEASTKYEKIERHWNYNHLLPLSNAMNNITTDKDRKIVLF